MTNFQRGYGEILPDWVPPDEDYITEKEAGRKAVTAFWRGACFGAVLATGAFIASAAFSGDTASFGGTGCTLVPVTGAAHIAELRCRNVITSGPYVSDGMMEAGGLTVSLRVLHGPGETPDGFIAFPPDGYFADPPVLILDEWADGVILIFPFVGA